jgi:SAM-dependent methyltransferase
MNKLDIIQFLINKTQAKKYLEIGVDEGLVLHNISCEYKIGVDPDPNSKATIYMTSDNFFKNNTEKFDIIFVDGLHHHDQVIRDINNSLLVLNKGGYIICHDMNPPTEIIQRVPRETEAWTGDCWKAWVLIRSQRSDLNMCVIDTDFGCGIINFGSQECINIDCDLTWDNFIINRKYWLNLVPVSYISKI